MLQCKLLNAANGDWPSGKAPGSGPVIGGSNPSSPAKKKTTCIVVFFFYKRNSSHSLENKSDRYPLATPTLIICNYKNSDS